MPGQVDTSIYQNQPNAFDTLGKIAGLQNTLNQNRLFQQQFQSNLAASQLFKDAVDPQTGQLDVEKFKSMLSQNPGLSYGVGPVIQQSQQMQAQQLGIQQQQIDTAHKMLSSMSDVLAPLTTNPNLTQKDVVQAAGSLVASGIPASKVIAAMTDPNDPMPQNGPALQQWVQRHYLNGLDQQGKLNMMFGTPQPVQQGSQTSIIAASPFGGVRNYGALPQFMSPSEAATPVQVYNPATQQPTMITKGQFAGTSGSGRSAGGAAAGGGMGIPAGPALGAEAAANTDATAAAAQGISLQQRADRVRDNKAILGNLEGALNQFTSGPSANWKKVAEALANQNLQSVGFPGFNTKAIASQEEFNKQAEMLAQSQFQALGGTGSNAQLDSVSITSPNSELSKLGNKGIISLLKGNEDAINVKNQAWQRYKQANGPQSYGAFSNSFNQVFDPRVFQSQYLSGEDKQKMLSGMTKTEKNMFRNDYNFAVQNGWIPDPRGRK